MIHNKIKDEGAQALANGFKDIKSKIKNLSLILMSNEFTPASGKSFAELLPRLTFTDSLYISLYANKIGKLLFSFWFLSVFLASSPPPTLDFLFISIEIILRDFHHK